MYAVILAGGSCSRLWPLSREQHPKQYLTLHEHGESLFQQTVARVYPLLPAEKIIVVTHRDQEAEIRRQLAAISLEGVAVLKEPEGRNTAPAIGLAAWHLAKNCGSQTIMAVLPADHLISDHDQFASLLARGEKAAKQWGLVIFGIRPDYPETGYGYIRRGAALPGGCYRVEQFVEKPGLEQARQFCQDGRYFWNSGMLVFQVGALQEQYRRFLPESAAILDRLLEQNCSSLEQLYPKLEAVSIDYGIMEKAAGVVVIPAELAWSDLGSWEAYYQLSPRDAAGNCLQGRVLAVDTSGSLILSRSRLVGVVGVENLAIVDTDDALLVCRRDRSQAVRQLYEELKRRGDPEYREHRTVNRPWGSYTVLEQGETYQVKRISVNPGARLSLQSHRHRSEHWVVVAGTALVTVDEHERQLAKGENVFIPAQAKHRLQNIGKDMLEVIEVQNGSYLGEDDIQRYEDDYGRLGQDEAVQCYYQWLGHPDLDEATRGELEKMKDAPDLIRDHFGGELVFGTGGMRGIIGPGINRINRYIVRRATQGLANYINSLEPAPAHKRVAIAYDTRQLSREFAREAALVLAANGIEAVLFSEVRPTPELSYAIRRLECAAGIVITASHNPPEYNGYKVYGPDGGQAVSPLIDRLVEAIVAVDLFRDVVTMEYEAALAAGLIREIGPEMDRDYLEAVRSQSQSRPRSRLKVVYTPLHGTGGTLIPDLLRQTGYVDLAVVEEQMTADPFFSTVKVPNPEDPASFELALKLAEEIEADLVMATDPDCDRMGCAVREAGGGYRHFTGNQIGALMIEYILSRLAAAKRLPENGVIVKTIVTGDLGRKVAASYGVDTEETLTGFKFIGEKIKEYEESGRKTFLFGYEESYGYLAGTYTRDKDGVVASLLTAEMAAYYRDQGQTLSAVLESLQQRHGYFREDLVSLELKNMAEADVFLSAFNAVPPQLNGVTVVEKRDYNLRKAWNLLDGTERGLTLPRSPVLYYRLQDGSWFCVRPSGTEPKIKIYFSVCARESGAAAEQKMARFKEAVLAIPNLKV